MAQEYFRRRNLLSPFGNSGFTPSFQFQFPDPADMDNQSSPPPPRSVDMSDLYGKLMGMEAGPAQQKYRQFLDEQTPNRDDYKPTKMNRLAAMLTGVSEGIARGGATGYGAARRVLEEPYSRAVADYNTKGDKLSKAAELEEKNIGNRVKVLWDTLRYNQDANRLDEAKRLNDARIKDYDARAAERGKPKLMNSYTDPSSGIRRGVFSDSANPQGFRIMDLGKGGFTPEEQVTLAGKKAGAESTATLPGRITVARVQGEERRNTQKQRFESIQKLNEWKKNNANYSLFPQPGGNVIAINKTDPSDSWDTGIDSGKWTDQQKNEGAKEVKKTPSGVAPTTRTTKTTVKGDERTSTTTVTPGASGKVRLATPGGKAMTINGVTATEFMLDPSEVDEALKHGWTRK